MSSYLDKTGLATVWRKILSSIEVARSSAYTAAVGQAETLNNNLKAYVDTNYLSKASIELTFATKEDLANALTSAMTYKGSKDTYDSLPSSGNAVGDVWNVNDTGANYAWNGTGWDPLGGAVDMSAYITKAESITSISGGQNTITFTKGDGTTQSVSTSYVSSPVGTGGDQYIVNHHMSYAGDASGGGVLKYNSTTRTFKCDGDKVVNITGNAATATSATNDKNGRDITNTYLAVANVITDDEIDDICTNEEGA